MPDRLEGQSVQLVGPGSMTGHAAPASPHGPYGPRTRQVRDFLVRFAGLGAHARANVVTRFNAVSNTPEFLAAEALLGETIARAGLLDARDALAGPLLQLVRVPDAAPLSEPSTGEQDVILDAIAEPALAALLAILTEELVDPDMTRRLYAPFDEALPR